MQHHAVIYECDLVERMTGGPFVLLPVKAPGGYSGVMQLEPAEDQRAYELAFDQPQVICAGGGIYLLAGDALSFEVAMGHHKVLDTYEVLSVEKVRLLMSHFEAGGCPKSRAVVSVEAGQ